MNDDKIVEFPKKFRDWVPEWKKMPKYVFILALAVAGSWLLIEDAGWKAWLGVFVMLWANNLELAMNFIKKEK